MAMPISRRMSNAPASITSMVDGCLRVDEQKHGSVGRHAAAHQEPQDFKRVLTVPILPSNAHDPVLAADAITSGAADMMILVARPARRSRLCEQGTRGYPGRHRVLPPG